MKKLLLMRATEDFRDPNGTHYEVHLHADGSVTRKPVHETEARKDWDLDDEDFTEGPETIDDREDGPLHEWTGESE